MSRENVEVVHAVIDAWNTNEFDGFLACLDPGLEWHTALSTAAEGSGSVYLGLEGAERAWREYRDTFGEVRMENPRFHDLDDRVLVLGKMTTKGRASGLELEEGQAQLMTVKDGLIVRSEHFRSHADGLEAAGLSE